MSSELEKAFKAALDGALYYGASQWGFNVLPTGIPALDRALGGGFAYGTIAEIFGDWGVGKGHPPWTPILTPSGWVPLEDIKPGDLVCGQSGASTVVTNVFHRGYLPTFSVRFSDDSSVLVDGEHLWAVQSSNDRARGKDYRVLSTQVLIDQGLHYGKRSNRKWSIPLVAPVEFAPQAGRGTHPPRCPPKQLIGPYTLGVLLGDGCLRNTEVAWTSEDSEIATSVRVEIADEWRSREGSPEDKHPPCTVKHFVRADRTDTWKILGRGKGYPNPFLDEIRRLGLFRTTSLTKFIPSSYLMGSIADREALLQGLLDTDGYAGNSIEYCSKSPQLADGVLFLVRSLGGTARVTEKIVNYKGEDRIYYRVRISLPPEIQPFRLNRKMKNYHPTRCLGRWIDSIEFVGHHEIICISVDAVDELYVTKDFIVTHNTMLLYILLAQNQRLGGTSVLFESEGAFYPEFYAALGGDPDTLLLKPIRTVEALFDGVYKLLKVMKAAKKKGKKDTCVMGWDSLAGTGTEHLFKTWDKGEKKQDMSKARRMSEGCALITQLVDETNAMVVATNQLRVNIGAADWERPHTPGGKGWPFHSSQRIELNFHGGPVGSQIHYEEGEGKKVHIGRKVRGEILKNRIAPPFRTFTMPLYTEAGYPHPMWKGEETKLGIDIEESTWNWISDPRSTFAVRNAEGIVTGRKRFCTSTGPYWSFAPEITAYLKAPAEVPRFYKKDFKKVLAGFPQLLMALYDPSRLCEQCLQFTPPPNEILCDPCKLKAKAKKKGKKK